MNTKRKILVLAANPGDTGRLRLDEEVRNIKEALRRASQRDTFELTAEFAVTPRALQQALLDVEPDIVHFCGHSTQQGLMLENNSGNYTIVSTEAISKTFETFADEKIECVILNACYSETQAKEIVKHVPYVIGMSDTIGDRSAIAFAESFYDTVGAGRGYEKAFKVGRDRLALEGSKDEEVVQLKIQTKRGKIPQIWLHGWFPYRSSNVDETSEVPDMQIDWTNHYSKTPFKIPTPEMWEQRLFPELLTLKREIRDNYTGQTIDLRSKLSLPAALALGYTFPETAGYVLQIEQGQDLWRTDTRPASASLKVVKSQGEKGKNLLVGIGITSNGWHCLESFAASAEQNFDAVVYLEPEKGVSSRLISSDAEAVAYAMDAKDLMRSQKQAYKATCIHLVLFAPAGFAVFLGHWLSRLGEVIPYEWNEPDYYPAFHLEAV
ncbi:MAG: hypothetical protein DCF25_20215 [Leptolyngbya foveolarum]|uniref:CHAT domain-containing protein n=1 Tax=Leptolyngbya foveolarum TaxID=47253 RepID=A0A2W4TP91_9CYAN|nr:MAG: hypothetical protein DCF25_20215 [Leptolyngbya foveolarum]